MFVLHIYNVGQNMPNFTGRNYFPALQNIFGVQTFSPLSFDQFSYGFGIGNTYGYSNGPSYLDQILNHIEQSYNFGYNFYNYNSATQPTYLDCIFNNMRQNPFIYNFINNPCPDSESDKILIPIDLYFYKKGIHRARFPLYEPCFSNCYYSPTDCATRNILNLLDRSCQYSSRPIKSLKNTKNSKNKNLALA